MLTRIKQALNKHLDFILEAYGIELHGKVELKLDLKGRAAGEAIHYLDTDQYVIRINPALSLDFILSDTLPHEVAHVLQGAFGSKLDHGRAWEFYCKQLGGTGLMYHTQPLEPSRKMRQWKYIVGGSEVIMSTIRHNRVQKGVQYTFGEGLLVSKEHFVGELK